LLLEVNNTNEVKSEVQAKYTLYASTHVRTHMCANAHQMPTQEEVENVSHLPGPVEKNLTCH